MTPTATRILAASAARIELETAIKAPLAMVWKAVVEQPDAWWVSELRCVPDSKIVFAPQAGGHFVEQNESGASLLWFTVIAIEPPHSVNFAGAIAPPFGGPCQVYLHLHLEQHAAGTLAKLISSMHGHLDEGMLPEIESGWRLLLEKGLKRFVETGQRV